MGGHCQLHKRAFARQIQAHRQRSVGQNEGHAKARQSGERGREQEGVRKGAAKQEGRSKRPRQTNREIHL